MNRIRKILGLPKKAVHDFMSRTVAERLGMVSMGLFCILGVTVTVMWTRITTESDPRCESLSIVAELFDEVGARSAPPSPKLLEAYSRFRAYSVGNPDDEVARFLLAITARSYGGENAPQTPTSSVLESAGAEIRRACGV